MKSSQSTSKRVDLSTFPSYDKCYELSKDEEQAFRDFYWNAVLWLMDFEASLRSFNYTDWVIAYYLRNPTDGMPIKHIIKEFIEKEVLGDE